MGRWLIGARPVCARPAEGVSGCRRSFVCPPRVECLIHLLQVRQAGIDAFTSPRLVVPVIHFCLIEDTCNRLPQFFSTPLYVSGVLLSGRQDGHLHIVTTPLYFSLARVDESCISDTYTTVVATSITERM